MSLQTKVSLSSIKRCRLCCCFVVVIVVVVLFSTTTTTVLRLSFRRLSRRSLGVTFFFRFLELSNVALFHPAFVVVDDAAEDGFTALDD